MRRRSLISIILALLLLMLPGQVSYATPSPPYILLNEALRQCYVSIMNDECFWCEPPAGWKIMGTGNESYGTTECPAGFQKIEHLELNCTRYKTSFCCGFSSAHGNCEDMIVNATLQACAFVDDIHACTVPPGWSSRPTGVLESNWSCNSQYHWLDRVSCEAPAPASPAVPVIGLGLIALGSGMLLWLARRRTSR